MKKTEKELNYKSKWTNDMFEKNKICKKLSFSHFSLQGMTIVNSMIQNLVKNNSDNLLQKIKISGLVKRVPKWPAKWRIWKVPANNKKLSSANIMQKQFQTVFKRKTLIIIVSQLTIFIMVYKKRFPDGRPVFSFEKNEQTTD